MFNISVADRAGNMASAEQQLVFTDDTPPSMNCPDTLWYPMNGDVVSEMPDISCEIDIAAGACDTPYTFIQSPISGSFEARACFKPKLPC